jgi:GNAT superfamily N-acetyltransferase
MTVVMIHSAEYMTVVMERKHPDPAAFAVVPLRREELPGLLAMVRRCSRETLFRRFHGFTDGISYARHLTADGDEQETVVAWLGERCLGFATLAGGGDEADVGVLVEDAWQRRGVGGRLIAELVDLARRRHVTRLRADVLADAAFVIPVLSRFGRMKMCVHPGGYSVRVELHPSHVTAALGA